jgi:TIR domain
MGVIVRKLFVSYARENKRDVDQLVEHLGTMGYQTWVDAALRGGQEWWEEILARIADSDVVIAIYSSAALNSTACGREFEWAVALGKPVVPVAVEPPPTALPSRFARRQIIDYSEPTERPLAALQLQGALATLPPPPPLPDPLPEPPKAPLSYLTDIIDLITQANALDHDQQHQILHQLEPALTSFDPLERRGGLDILERFSTRRDLYADVDRAITRLRQLPAQPVPVDGEPSGQNRASTAEQSEVQVGRDDLFLDVGPSIDRLTPLYGQPGQATEAEPPQPWPTAAVSPEPELISALRPAPERKADQTLISRLRQNSLATAGALIVLAAIPGLVEAIASLNIHLHGYSSARVNGYLIAMLFFWLLIAISFSVLARGAKSYWSKSVMIIGWLMAGMTILTVATVASRLLLLFPDVTDVRAFLIGFVSLLAIAFGVMVFRSRRALWAPGFVLWGLCGVVQFILDRVLVEFFYGLLGPGLYYFLRSCVPVAQIILLLAVGVLMYRESRPGRNEPTAKSA